MEFSKKSSLVASSVILHMREGGGQTSLSHGRRGCSVFSPGIELHDGFLGFDKLLEVTTVFSFATLCEHALIVKFRGGGLLLLGFDFCNWCWVEYFCEVVPFESLEIVVKDAHSTHILHSLVSTCYMVSACG